ncbi:MAG: isochorismate synthase [Aequorivita sp.]
MDFNLLIEKIAQHYDQHLPFVIYSLPDSERIFAKLQNSDKLHRLENLTENGFVLAPFDSKESAVLIPESESKSIETNLVTDEIDLAPVAISETSKEKEAYVKLLDKTVDTIKGRKARKIVLSRQKDFPLQNFSIEKLIKQLFSIYPTAFRYVWYHPKTGIWCGATPETLVQVENNSFKTMALAGTQPFTITKKVAWGSKELDEQQLVTDSITNSLQRVTSVLKISNPYTHRAGSLLHLRSDITGILKNGKATLTTIAAALHPTPAVCGTPQKAAKTFILENENSPREFYTGFLGPISLNGAAASIMVNLRCMKIEDDTARIYVGGGITLGSNPHDEWTETQNKMQTMLQVLKPML